jgi:ABC-type nickel/cobalt efflux system permease component RcnA
MIDQSKRITLLEIAATAAHGIMVLLVVLVVLHALPETMQADSMGPYASLMVGAAMMLTAGIGMRMRSLAQISDDGNAPTTPPHVAERYVDHAHGQGCACHHADDDEEFLENLEANRRAVRDGHPLAHKKIFLRRFADQSLVSTRQMMLVMGGVLIASGLYPFIF